MGTEQLLLIGGLAILDTLSPTTIGVTIYLLLTDKERLTKRLFVYLLTVAGCYFVVGVSLMLGLNFLFEIISGVFQNRIVSWTLFIIEPYYSSQAFIFHQRKVQSSLHQNQIAFFP